MRPVGPDQVRPHRLWYWVAGAIVLAGLVVAVVSAVLAAGSAGRIADGVAELDLELRPVPDDPSAVTPVDVPSGETWSVYVAVPRTGTGQTAVVGPAPAVSCTAVGLTVTPFTQDVTTVQDGVAYRPVLTVRAEPGATAAATITCDAEGRAEVDGAVDADLALAPALDLAALRQVGAGILGTVAGVFAAVVAALLGLLVGGAVAFVTALRRSRHRAALRPLGEWHM